MESKIELMLNKISNGEYVMLTYFYNKKQDFLSDFKDYLSNNPEKAYELSILEDSILHGDLHSKDFNVFYLDRILPEGASNYIVEFQTMINLYKKDKFSALRKFNEYFSQCTFESNIDKFEAKFINAPIFMDILMDLKDSLKYKQVKSNKMYFPVQKNLNYYIDEKLVKDIYDSGLSLLDYACKHTIDYAEVNHAMNYTKNAMLQEIGSRPDTVEELLVDLIKKLANDEIDFIDYFKVCKLNPRHLKPFVTKYKLQGKTISSFITKNSKAGNVSLENEENSKIIINGVEVPYEIKKEAIDSIMEVEAPLTQYNYNIMIKKLMKNRAN